MTSAENTTIDIVGLDGNPMKLNNRELQTAINVAKSMIGAVGKKHYSMALEHLRGLLDEQMRRACTESGG